ncbi:hypothetical protein [Oceanobacillus massiliensis]|uniref:hypothetical protein n=1 Tax=Oceanobacillus massiliensis TaxID=1465765 RepID=UPI000288EC6D|nr:hypothetical protein [Oceanobacillus massiliensis]
MTLDEALKQINPKKEQYFRWKFDLYYDKRNPKKTEQQLMDYTEVKTMNSFISWEKTPEYKALLQLYLDYKATQDFEEIYNLVSERAKEKGEDKDVKLFLQLKKEIKENNKIVKQIFNNSDDVAEDDGLELE